MASVLGIGMGVVDDASHRVGEQSGAGERKVSGPPGLDVPYITKFPEVGFGIVDSAETQIR